jgi:hypothetical protein
MANPTVTRFIFIIAFFVPNWLLSQGIYLCTLEGEVYDFDLNTCKTSLLCDIDSSLFDIAAHPNGKLYGIGATGELYEIDLSDCSDTIISKLEGQVFNSLVCSANGLIYTTGSEGELWSFDVLNNTKTFLGSIGYMAAGDLTFNKGILYMAAVGNELIQVDLEKPSNSFSIYNINVVGNTYGVFSAVSDCVNSVTYVGVFGSVYEIDVPSNKTTFKCEVPFIIAGATSQYEFLSASPVIIDSIITVATSCGTNDGKITVYASGGTNQLKFSLDNTFFQTTNSFVNLSTTRHQYQTIVLIVMQCPQ